jgi:hypothetical protein
VRDETGRAWLHADSRCRQQEADEFVTAKQARHLGGECEPGDTDGVGSILELRAGAEQIGLATDHFSSTPERSINR